jgi:hypothetical protein
MNINDPHKGKTLCEIFAQGKKQKIDLSKEEPHLTVKKPRLPGSGDHPNSRANLIPFKKGHDHRRAIGGRPKSFVHFRKLAQKIASEPSDERAGMSKGEVVLRRWLKSQEPQLQRAFIEYAFGKVPDKLESDALDRRTTLILHYGHEKEKRDADHQRLSSDLPPGAD